MNDKKQSKILLQVIERVYNHYPGMTEFTNSSMVDISLLAKYLLFCFLFFFAVVFIVIYGFLCSAVKKQKLKIMLLINEGS